MNETSGTGSRVQMKLRFLGAAKNVTGSAYLLDAGGMRLLIDCGMYQEHKLKSRNWEAFQVPPQSIDAVLLTHAHLDHCGRLPKLVKDGFQGKIYGTEATNDIAQIVLLDSARIQEEDAEHKRRRHEREGRTGPYPVMPLYTTQDAEACIEAFQAVRYHEDVALSPKVTARFYDAGHILGSSMIKLTVRDGGQSRSIVFSGDVGRCHSPILRDPETIEAADYVVVESTYGNRLHKDNSTIPEDLAEAVNHAHQSGGNIVIPSFAVERSQEILYHLSQLLDADAIPHLAVFLDSPMAVRVTEVFHRHHHLFDEESRQLLREGRHPCDFPGLVMSRTVAESKAINHIKGTVVIIAGSGMCTGGRIKHHLVNNIGRPESTLLFIGYQAQGTLGRILLEKNSPVRIFGQPWDVKAKISRINGFSAHADRDEMFRWLSGLKQAPRHVFVTHGETAAAQSFSDWLANQTGWETTAPDYEDEVVLD